MVRLAPAARVVAAGNVHVTCWRLSAVKPACVGGETVVGTTEAMPVKVLDPATKLNRVAALLAPPDVGRMSRTMMLLAAALPVFVTVIV